MCAGLWQASRGGVHCMSFHCGQKLGLHRALRQKSSLSTVHYQNGLYFYDWKYLCVWLAMKSPQQKVPGMVAAEKAVGH